MFVSEWSKCDFYFLSGAGIILQLAWWRCQRVTPWLLRSFVVPQGSGACCTVVGSWVLLDHFKLALFPQLQPARALIFMVVFHAHIVVDRSGKRFSWLTHGNWRTISGCFPVSSSRWTGLSWLFLWPLLVLKFEEFTVGK